MNMVNQFDIFYVINTINEIIMVLKIYYKKDYISHCIMKMKKISHRK